VLGRRGCGVGPLGPLRAREKREKACGLKLGRLGEKKKRGRGRGKRVFFFFFNFFSNSFSNIQTSIKQKSMHSNHDAQALIISKLF
jgi:hypothetical protein